MMVLKIPPLLKAHHESLIDGLHGAHGKGWALAERVKRLIEALHPHVEKEESMVFPILGVMRRIAEGRDGSLSKEAVPLALKFRRSYQELLEEHKKILGFILDVEAAAQEAKDSATLNLMEELKHHIEEEEEILYPAALVTGKVVASRK